MNTGFLRHAVATVLTVYGIETSPTYVRIIFATYDLLQQCLPFTVLKRFIGVSSAFETWSVATVLTVYGIETIGIATS